MILFKWGLFLKNKLCGKANITFWLCIEVISRAWAHPNMNMHSKLPFSYTLLRNEIHALQEEKYTAEWYNVILQSSATAAILNLQYKMNYRVQWIRDHYGSKRNCFNIMMVVFVLNRWHIKICCVVVSSHEILFCGIPTLCLEEFIIFLSFSGRWLKFFLLGKHPECWGPRNILQMSV